MHASVLRIPLTFAVLAPLVALGGCQRNPSQGSGPAPHGGLLSPAPAAAAPVSAVMPIPGGPAPFSAPPMLSGTPDVAALVAQIKPAVVNITTVHELRAPRMQGNFPFGLDPFGGMGPGDPRGG